MREAEKKTEGNWREQGLLLSRLPHYLRTWNRLPPRLLNEFFIRRLNPLVIVDFSPAYVISSEFTREVNNARYLSVNVFSTKVLTGDTNFYVSLRRRDRHFTWSSEPSEGLAVCSAKAVPSFLSYFKTLRIGLTTGIEPATFRSQALYRLS